MPRAEDLAPEDAPRVATATPGAGAPPPGEGAIEPAWGPALGTARPRVRGAFFERDGRTLPPLGCTWGPFRPNASGEPFPEPARARADLALLRGLGLSSARVYDPPPRWLLDLAAEAGVALLVGIPWQEHVCGLGERRFERAIRGRVRDAVRDLAGHPAVLGVLVGNEIPSQNVRWQGPETVERFLGSLLDAAKDADPGALVSYASYPPTEYLTLERFDFACMNVYLHDRRAFRSYLARSRNNAGHRPFVLGEVGADAIREGPEAQRAIVAASLEEALRSGAAGAFVFALTDEWWRGGEEVQGWAFGVTDRERRPRPLAHAVRSLALRGTRAALPEAPPLVSVVVASKDGSRTIAEALDAIARQDYPRLETIVVDDGSTDRTAEIAASRAGVRLLRLGENRGLSAARNAGIEAALGEVVAFCDDDAAPDPLWLTHIVAALEGAPAAGEARGGVSSPRAGGPRVAAAGGPNLPPEGDSRVAAAVAAAPGGPTHVLLDDERAEHIPGCNMAFRRQALLETGGFDARFRAAGDDVDICWRLRDRGLAIAYAPSAIVRHHRRGSVSAYLRQQIGYGAAEADLAAKHPGRFNAFGGALWEGRIYSSAAGAAAPMRVLGGGERRIRYGEFGLGLFQTIYQPGEPLGWELAQAPEAALAGALALAAGLLVAKPFLALAGLTLCLAPLAAALRRAAKAPLEPRHDSIGTRALVAWMTLLQPWVRRWAQVRRTRALRASVGFTPARPERSAAGRGAASKGLETAYWSQDGGEREAFLAGLEAALGRDGFPVRRGGEFEAHDLEALGDLGARATVATVMEYHGGPRRLLRLRAAPRLTRGARAATVLLGAVALAGAALGAPLEATLMLAAALVVLLLALRRRAAWLAEAVLARAAEVARTLGFTPLEAGS